MAIFSKNYQKRGATRVSSKQDSHVSTPLKRPTSDKRRLFAYLSAGAACICSGAYMAHDGDSAPLTVLSPPPIEVDQPKAPQLELKYAYFGAPAVKMPSEKLLIDAHEKAIETELNTSASQAALSLNETNLEGQPIQALHTEHAPAIPQDEQTFIAIVSRGDSFSTVGQKFGLSVREAANIMQDKVASKYLSTIIPGEQITFRQNDGGKVEQIIYLVDDTRTLVLDRKSAFKFDSTVDEVSLKKRILVNMGVVENSLFLSAAKAGVSNRHIMQMVDIFRWDIDFAMEVRPGDTYKLIFEGFYNGEKLVRTGRLIGVEFKGRSTHRALYFEDNSGNGAYYTPRGRQLQKQFLRNPVDTVRITSPFNLKRKHPVLNTIRAHKGVDYGAPTGTPIKATADGVVKYSGRRGSYGQTVELQHGKKYTTLYAHMSKIHPNSQVGKRVKQGQVIGYVGKTGRVTGPHLHYEFRVKGVHVNPQTVKFAGAGQVPSKQMKKFKTATAPILQQLNTLNPNRFALSQTE